MFDIFMDMHMKEDESKRMSDMIMDKHNAITILNATFSNNWTYKIDNVIIENQISNVVVTVGLPGLVRSGFGRAIDTSDAINLAILDVLNNIVIQHNDKEFATNANIAPDAPHLPMCGVLKLENLEPQEQMKIPGIEKLTEGKENNGGVNEPPVTEKPKVDPPAQRAKVINPKIKKVMDKLNITEEVATDYAKVCKKYNINTKEKLLKYLQAWNIDIKDTKDLKEKDVEGFVIWCNTQEEFTID